MAKTVSKSFSLNNSWQKSAFLAVLMYALYGHPRYFKFTVCVSRISFRFLWLCLKITNDWKRVESFWSYTTTEVWFWVLLINWWFSTNVQKQSPRGVLKNFAKFMGKHLRQSLFFNKVAGLRHLFYRTPPDNCCCFSKCLWRFLKWIGWALLFGIPFVGYTFPNID